MNKNSHQHLVLFHVEERLHGSCVRWPEGMSFVTKVLRDTLDKVGLAGIGIIAADGDWSISNAMTVDPYLNDAVEVVG